MGSDSCSIRENQAHKSNLRRDTNYQAFSAAKKEEEAKKALDTGPDSRGSAETPAKGKQSGKAKEPKRKRNNSTEDVLGYEDEADLPGTQHGVKEDEDRAC